MSVRSNRTRGWFWIHNEVLDRFGEQLGPFGIAVYTTLARMTDNDTQGCVPTVKALCKKTGMSESKMRNELHALADMKLIEIKERYTEEGDRTSNEYILLPIPEETQNEQDLPQEATDRSRATKPTVRRAMQSYKKDPSSQDPIKQDSLSFVQQPKNGHAGTIEPEWPHTFLPVKKLLSDLNILPPLNDPAYWQAIEAWTDTCGFQIYYLDELRAYHAYQMSLKPGGRHKHKDLKAGFRTWIGNAINFRRRDAERKAHWQQQRR